MHVPTKNAKPASRSLRWRYLEQYGSEVLCTDTDARPLVFGTVFKAVETARQLGGCALGRCLHAPMRWVLIRTDTGEAG